MDLTKAAPVRGFYVTPDLTCLTDLSKVFNLLKFKPLICCLLSVNETIQQYSPPSECITCELAFSHFFRERSFRSRQNPRVDFFLGKKRLRRIENGILPFTVVEFCGRWIVYNSRLFA